MSNLTHCNRSEMLNEFLFRYSGTKCNITRVTKHQSGVAVFAKVIRQGFQSAVGASVPLPSYNFDIRLLICVNTIRPCLLNSEEIAKHPGELALVGKQGPK